MNIAYESPVAPDDTTATNGEFLIRRTGDIGVASTVTYQIGGTATRTSDYTAFGSWNSQIQAYVGSVSFEAWQEFATVTLKAVNDASREEGETVVLTLLEPSSGQYEIGTSSATVTIEDNDDWEVSIAASQSQPSASEDGPLSSKFTVTRSGESDLSQSLSVNYQISGTATSADRSGSSSGWVTIPAGQISADLAFTTTNDAIREGDESITVTLVVPSGSGLAPYRVGSSDAATITLEDNDDWEVSVEASASSASEQELAGAQFTITRTGEGDYSKSLTVQYQLSGTATAGADFTNSASVTIPAGQRSATVTVRVLNDGVRENDESITLTIITPSGAPYRIGTASDTVTLEDNDDWEVSVAATQSTVYEQNQTGAQFIVSRSGEDDLSNSLTVSYQLSGSASSSADYLASHPNTVVIPAGQTSAVVTVRPTNDGVREEDETITLTIVTPSGGGLAPYRIGTASDTITLVDNDDWEVSVAASQSTIYEQHEVGSQFIISRSGESDLSNSLTVYFDLGGTATRGAYDDYGISGELLSLVPSGTSWITIPAGQQSAVLHVRPFNDAERESNETISVTLVTPSGGGTAPYRIGEDSAIMTLVDNDDWEISVTASSSAMDEATGAGGWFEFTRSGEDDLQYSLYLTYELSGSASSADHNLTTGTRGATVPAGQNSVRVYLHPDDDGIEEPLETVVATLLSSSNDSYTLGSATSANLSIAASQAGPYNPSPATNWQVNVESVESTAYEENHQGGSFRISRSGNSNVSQSLSVLYQISGTASHTGGDYTAISTWNSGQQEYHGTITIPAGQSSVLVHVNSREDTVAEDDETVVLTLRESSAYTIGSQSDATVTIVDEGSWELNITTSTPEVYEEDRVGGQFVVTRSGLSSLSTNLSVSYEVTGTAIHHTSVDYESISGWYPIPQVYRGTAHILAGQTSVTIDINPANDALTEGDETIIVTLTDSPYYSIGSNANSTITIKDNDDQWTVDIAAVQNQASEQDQVGGRWVVTRSGSADLSQSLGVQYRIGGSATRGSDYPAFGTWSSAHQAFISSVTIPAGQTSAFIDVATNNDFLAEDDETLQLTLIASGNANLGYTIGSQDSATVTIADNDTWEMNVAIVEEFATEQGQLGGRVLFTRSGQTDFSQATTVYYKVTGTATPGGDYTALGSWNSTYQAYVGSISLPAGQASAALDIFVNNDGSPEQDETIVVTLIDSLSASYNYTIGSQESATVTIIDNDHAEVSIAATRDQASEHDRVDGQFTFSRSAESDLSQSLTVYFKLEGTATRGSDYSSIGSWNATHQAYVSSVTIPVGHLSTTLNIAATNDTSPEEEETIVVTLIPSTSASHSYTFGSESTATVTIAANDQWEIGVSAPINTVYEPESSELVGKERGLFTITRSGERDLTHSLQVTYELTGVARSGVDFRALPGFVSSTLDSQTGTYIVRGNVTIAVGEYKTQLDVVPLYDGLGNEGFEAVKLAIVASTTGAYAVNSQSPSATVTIRDTDPNTSVDCNCDCGCPVVGTSTDTTTGNLKTLDRATGILHNNNANPHPIIATDAKLAPTKPGATLSWISASLTLGGMAGPTVYYDATGVTANDLYRFALQMDAIALPTGRHDWEISITQGYSDSTTRDDVHTGYYDLINLSESAFGRGRSAEWLDRLVVQDDGALLVRGDGNAFWFQEQFGTVYARSAGEFAQSELRRNADGSFTLTSGDGLTSQFDTDGLLTETEDRWGNVSSYSYIDADGDTLAHEIYQVQSPGGRTTTVAYANGLVSTITDFAGRETTFTFDTQRRVTDINHADPDGAGSQTGGTTSFTYVGDTNRVAVLTKPSGSTTTYGYDFSGRLASQTTSSGPSYLESVQSAALVDTSGTVGTQGNPAALVQTANVRGAQTNELGERTEILVGRLGLIESSTDDEGNTTYSYRNSEGLVTEVHGADPDGAGPLSAPVTTYTFDVHGNVLTTTHPDNSVEAWTYDTTFNQPVSYTDQLGRVTLYTLDAQGNVTAVQQVVGELDDQINGETDDVLTTFTYTTSTTPGNVPFGLVTSITDAMGRVTTLEYNSRGLTTEITYAVGTADEATRSFEYDTADNLTAEIDELGRRTEYEYDALGQVITITEADPDGAGPLSSPVTRYEYNAMGSVTKMIDPLLRETLYTYGARGNLVKVEEPDHDNNSQLTTTQYGYDALGRTTSQTDPLGRVVAYGYDTVARKTSVTLPSPDGIAPAVVSETEYDRMGRVVATIDPRGNRTEFEYINWGREIVVTQPSPDGLQANPETRYEYDAAGQLIRETDALGRVTEYSYDALGRLSQIEQPDPDGAGPQQAPLTSYQYDKVGNLRFVVDPLNNVTEYVYDNRNRLVSIIEADPDGAGAQSAPVTSYVYDDAGQLVSETDPLGRVTSYAYDNLGRLVQMTLPDPDGAGSQTSPVIAYAYDAAGNQISQTDALGNVTTYAFDALNHLVTITEADPDGAGPLAAPVTTQTYDAASRLIQSSDPLGRNTVYEYDNLDRLTKVTMPDPDGAGSALAPFNAFTYDEVGNRLTESNARGLSKTFSYDNLYRLISETDANGDSTQFTYDAVGNLITLTDPVANTTTWTYDALNRATQETNELGHSRYFEYDLAGNLTKKTDRNERVLGYEYDNLYRRISEQWFANEAAYQSDIDVRTISFGYDLAGQLLSTSDPDHDYDYSYDGLGRVTSHAQAIAGLTPVVTFAAAYDLVGNRTQLAAQLGGTADFVNQYSYDNLHRLTQLTQAGQSGGNSVAAKRIDFSYDAASQRDQITRYADLAGTKLVATTDFTFDLTGRLTGMAHAQGATSLVSHAWQFDAANRLTQYVNSIDGTVDYAHDDRDQLTGADYDYQTDEAYTYDENGNRTNTGYVTGDNNQLLSDGVFDYEYDQEGNRTRRVTIATGATTVFTWDHRNRLTSVTEYASEADADLEQNVLKAVEHTYDAFNQWTSRTVDPDGDSGTAALEKTFFLYDQGQIALQFDKTGGGDATASDLSHRYLWSDAVDQLLADENAAGEILWPLTDHLGTVRDLAEYDDATDTTAIVNHRTYDAFGNLTSETNAAVDSLFGYTGRPLDEATGLQNNLHRWYDAEAGRWVSEDPIGFEAGDSNISRYVGNSPVLFVDPRGLEERFSLTDVKPGLNYAGTMQMGGRSYHAFYVYNTKLKKHVIYPDLNQPVDRIIAPPQTNSSSQAAQFGGLLIVCGATTQVDSPFSPVADIAAAGMLIQGSYDIFWKREVPFTGQPICAESQGQEESSAKERSPHPIGSRYRFNTRKKAYEAAKRAGKGAEPVNHPDGPHGPHFHPGNGRGKPLNHDHYYYPKHAEF